MARNLTLSANDQIQARTARSWACLAAVALLTLAFWSGAAWIVEVLIHATAHNF